MERTEKTIKWNEFAWKKLNKNLPVQFVCGVVYGSNTAIWLNKWILSCNKAEVD